MHEPDIAPLGRAGRYLRGHAANAVTLLALPPLLFVLRPSGLAYLPAMLLLVDFIDSVDGVVARYLKTSSSFGAQLDRTCDAIVHGGLVVVIASLLPGVWSVVGLLPVVAIVIRLTRQAVGQHKRVGSSTNELLRHLYLSLLLVDLGAPAVPLIPIVMAFHTATMLRDRPMPYLLRQHARQPWQIGVFYAVLLGPLFWPLLAIPYAAIFAGTWLFSVAFGGE